MTAIKEFFKKNKLWPSPAIFVLMLGLVGYFAVFRLLNDIQGKADMIQQKMIDTEIAKKRTQNLPEIKKNIDAINARKGSLEMILDEKSELDFIRKLEGVAEQTGNRITIQIKDQPADAQKKTAKKDKDKEDIIASLPYDKYIMFEITTEGNYSQLFNFVHKLENFDYYVNIVSINATKIEEESETSTGEQAAPGTGKEFLKTTMVTAVYLKK
jgi:hypothetical protein